MWHFGKLVIFQMPRDAVEHKFKRSLHHLQEKICRKQKAASWHAYHTLGRRLWVSEAKGMNQLEESVPSQVSRSENSWMLKIIATAGSLNHSHNVFIFKQEIRIMFPTEQAAERANCRKRLTRWRFYTNSLTHVFQTCKENYAVNIETKLAFASLHCLYSNITAPVVQYIFKTRISSGSNS